MKKYQYLILPISLFLIFVVFTILVKTLDVHYLSINNTYIGLYTMNHAINTWIVSYGKMEFSKVVSDVLMYVSFVFVLGYVIAFVIQWFKRKSLKLVDQRYYLLLGIYALTVIIYVIFELVKVNYAPLFDGELKSSYPSTHVMVTTIFFTSSSLVAVDMLSITKKYLRIIVYVLLGFIALLVGFVRLLSGRHWFSDIIASYLIFGMVIALFIHAYHIIKERESNKEELN